ncbi:MAG: amino acid-binding protein [Candidatus Delongbacteria bacterium]|nr:amino acid-binding protein [Candidatus Delongbacteria bacterium]
MNITVEKVDVWAAGVNDQTGNLSNVLKTLREVGADLELIIARRAAEKPGTGVVFVAPLRGDEEIKTAAMLGFNITSSVNAIRVQGHDIPGITSRVTEKLAATGISLRGLTTAVIGPRFIMYIGLDTSEDTAAAIRCLKE